MILQLSNLILFMIFINISMTKVEIKRQSQWLSIELLPSCELILRVASDYDLKTCIFEKIINFQSLSGEMKCIFENTNEVFEVLKAVIGRNIKQDILIQSSGRVHFQLELKIFQKIIKKKITFNLEKTLKNDQEVQLLRAGLQIARKQIAELKAAFIKIADENSHLKAKFNYLQQMVLTGQCKQNLNKKQSDEKKPNRQQFQKCSQQKNDGSDKKKKEQERLIEEGQSNEQLLAVPLNIQFDENCMYYNKFSITKNKVISLFEDYYQIYSKSPLPKNGVYKIQMRMLGENHLSIGIIGKSALNNQYSFQNNKAICFYSYFYGNFRGIYFRSKYEPLTWLMQVGQIVQLQLNMNRKTLKINLKGHPSIEQIYFKQLYDEEQLYFFIEMYQKNNSVQFLQ